MTIVIVTRPPLERHLNWVSDPVPPPARCPDDLAAPSPSEKAPPQDASSKLPRRLRPRRRRERQPGFSTNHNSASRVAGPATQLRSPANRNSARPSSSAVTRPRSAANQNSLLPGQRPGTSRLTMSTPGSIPGPSCAHSIPDCRPIRIQDADLTRTTLNSGVYINRPSQASSRITTPAFVETPSPDLASPHLPYSDRDSFSESPSGQLNKKSVTDSKREVRIARGQRPGIVYPLPRAARPDTRLEMDAALHRAERPPTILDIPETGRLEETRCPESSHRRGSCSARRHTRKRPRNHSSGMYRPRKCSPYRGHWCE